MPSAAHGASISADRHQLAVLNTLRWADLSAAEGDYAGAVAWLDTVTAIGDELPDPYPERRAAWRTAMCATRSSGRAG